jgi:hypothetical protein
VAGGAWLSSRVFAIGPVAELGFFKKRFGGGPFFCARTGTDRGREMDFTELVEAYLRLVERRQLARLDAELWKFAEALDQWLYALVLNPRPDWREELDKFLAREAEAGRVAMPEGRQSIIGYLERWAKKIGLEGGSAEQANKGTGEREPADSQAAPVDATAQEPASRGGAASDAYVERFDPLRILEEEIARRPGEAGRLPEVLPPRLEIRPPRIVEIKVLSGIWGHYDELITSGRYEPSTLTRAFVSFARQILPSSEPTTRITFDDGTVLILLGGGPDSGALAGQAAFMLGAQGAVASSASLREAVRTLFGHLGREAAESVADEVIQQTTGLPVGPLGVLPKKGKGPSPESRRARAPESPGFRAPKYWKRTVEFQGLKVYQRDDLIDPGRVDRRGRTNVQRMRAGAAPIGPDGKSLEFHHLLQTDDGPLAEVTRTFHAENRRILHINPPSIPSGINRPSFDVWREQYWKNRAKDFAEESR